MKTAKTKEIVKFDVETAVIVALDAKYKDLTITDGKSYAVVMQGIAEYREIRLAVAEGHKKEKKDALEHCNFLDAEKRRILERLAPGEDSLKSIRQAWDDEKAAIKAEKAAKETARIEAIQEKINAIRDLGIMPAIVSSLVIEERLIIIKAMQISKEVYQESTDQATQAQKEAITGLTEALTQRLQFEKEEVARKAEAKWLETQRKEQEAAQAKIDEANRKIHDEKVKLEAEIIAGAERRNREDFERQATIKAEEEAKENARQKAEEVEALAAVEAKEKARQEALKPDRAKLIKFADGLYDIPIPDVKSAEAQQILSDASDVLDELSMNMKVQAKEL